ncbi:Mitochondrial amidoxime reducing component 2 [Paramyrothecium foliicola]|nr:Mitochondrial amidoxime reducing component 2 [Paramyrothecium foliicola]
MSSTSTGWAQFDSTAFILLFSTLIVFAVPLFILFPPVPVDRSDVLGQTHTKLGLSPSESNLRRQYDHLSHGAQAGKSAKVQSLHVYPVKSCRGIELRRSRVLPTGLEFDRLFTFAQLKNPPAALASAKDQEPEELWEFLTQRQLPLLANVKTDLWLPDVAKTSRLLGKVDGAFIVLRFPWTDAGVKGLMQQAAAILSRGLRAVPEKEILLPVEFPSKEEIAAQNYRFDTVKIWNETTRALNMGSEVPKELAAYLGAKRPLALFRMDPGQRREVFRCAPRKEDVGHQPIVDFHDAYPLHLLNLSSVQDLASMLSKEPKIEKLDVRRFRANIIVSGAKPYDEEAWKLIAAQAPADMETKSLFHVSCRTARCKMPNVDPANGVRHREEPDHTLRKRRNVDPGAPIYGCLGMQLCPIFTESQREDLELESVIEVGMEIGVLETGAHHYIEQ